jgi:outer membrane receptor protein involved in Fe transport
MDLGQVEVVKGVASALYGSGAMGGVINLLSRRPTAGPQREFLLNRSTRRATDAVTFLAGHPQAAGVPRCSVAVTGRRSIRRRARSSATSPRGRGRTGCTSAVRGRRRCSPSTWRADVRVGDRHASHRVGGRYREAFLIEATQRRKGAEPFETRRPQASQRRGRAPACGRARVREARARPRPQRFCASAFVFLCVLCGLRVQPGC